LLFLRENVSYLNMNTQESKNYSFSVVLTPEAEGGFTVSVPAIPGCFTEGDSLEEALENARDAIGLCIEQLMADGETIPTELTPSVISSVTISTSLQHA
jgi:predicted RNase H-like HicB family nuclease